MSRNSKMASMIVEIENVEKLKDVFHDLICGAWSTCTESQSKTAMSRPLGIGYGAESPQEETHGDPLVTLPLQQRACKGQSNSHAHCTRNIQASGTQGKCDVNIFAQTRKAH